jgi:hypothetical protein
MPGFGWQVLKSSGRSPAISCHAWTEDDAVNAWFEGLMTAWNQPRRRFETYAATDVVHWYWIDEAARVVMIVSCFERRKRR